MSIKCGKLSSALIGEHFGPAARRVHDELQWGPRTFGLLLGSCGLPRVLLTRALATLIQFDFVRFSTGRIPNQAEYSLRQENILLLLRYPKYLVLAEEKFGVVGRVVLEEVLSRGAVTATTAILRATAALQEESSYNEGLAGARKAFCDLVVSNYLVACGQPSSEKIPLFTLADSERFTPPELKLKTLQQLEKGENVEHEDVGKCWRLNPDRFHQDMRDTLLVEALSRRIDGRAGHLLKTLLTLCYRRTDPWAACTNPVPYLELRDAISDQSVQQYLEQYLRVIEEDSTCFVRRSGEGSASTVFINFAYAVRQATASVVDSVVERRFGPKAARIFRIIRARRFADQERLQREAMIPDKEAKQLIYRLLDGNLLRLVDLRKPAAGAAAKGFFLFHVDWAQAVRVCLETCYAAAYNCLTRGAYERKEHARLIEKSDKLLSIAECMRAQGTEEAQVQELVDEWITPPERSLLDTVRRTVDRLTLAQLYADDTVFILDLYSKYSLQPPQEKKPSSLASALNLF